MEQEQEQDESAADEFGDLASVMTAINASESEDSDTSDDDPDLEALLGM